CTQSDTCQSGACVGSNPVTCAAGDPCHVAGSCDPQAGTCSNPTTAPDGTSCDDGDACTVDDACGGGACGGTAITAPAQTTDLAASADKSTLTWSETAYATRYNVVRGTPAAFPVGSGADEVCFDDLATTSLSDAAVPDPGVGFWYLSRGENTCGVGSWGGSP